MNLLNGLICMEDDYHILSSKFRLKKISHIPIIFLLAANSTTSLPIIVNYTFVTNFLGKFEKF